MNNVYTLLLAGRPDGEARATSILLVCKERATKPAGLPAAAPRICPPGARAKVQTLFIDRP